MKQTGVVAAGDPRTAEAAQIILQEGGNAFDAALAALAAACVVEPVLASPGGGGFLLAHPAEGRNVLFDFFVHTPHTKRPASDIEFFPITCDFGVTTQEFHVGLGAAATPGVIKGISTVHESICTLPLMQIMEPAVTWARHGVILNEIQVRILQALEEIYTLNPAVRRIYATSPEEKKLLPQGATFYNRELAEALELMAREGDAPFYRGEFAQKLAGASREIGGYITLADLQAYRVVKRKPLETSFAGARFLTNPPPSIGGLLIAFALEMFQQSSGWQAPFGSFAHLSALAQAMYAADQMRLRTINGRDVSPAVAEKILQSEFIAEQAMRLKNLTFATGNTTHISVADAQGNLASLTVTNGEGCGYILPGTGIMLNNMLGEADLHPGGFQTWRENRRLSSMMAPSVLIAGDMKLAVGSGGSNRLRSAVMQAILNMVHFKLDVEQAVNHGRIHFEDGLLSVEDDFATPVMQRLEQTFPRMQIWPDKNFFFGGVHSVCVRDRGRLFEGAGDRRRGGACLLVDG